MSETWFNKGEEVERVPISSLKKYDLFYATRAVKSLVYCKVAGQCKHTNNKTCCYVVRIYKDGAQQLTSLPKDKIVYRIVNRKMKPEELDELYK